MLKYFCASQAEGCRGPCPLPFGHSSNLNPSEKRSKGQRKWNNGDKERRGGGSYPRSYTDVSVFLLVWLKKLSTDPSLGKMLVSAKLALGVPNTVIPKLPAFFWCLLQIKCPNNYISSLSSRLCSLFWTFSVLTIKCSWPIASRNVLCQVLKY